MFDLLIRGAQVVGAGGVTTQDVGIEGGVVTALAPEVSGPARQEVDAAGLHLFPGLVDSHVHLNEPGRTDWEGFTTGTRALAAGGATTFVDMPLNSSPPVLTLAALLEKASLGEQKSLLDFGLWGGLTPDNLEHLYDLAGGGAVGFKGFMSDSGLSEFRAADETTLRQGMLVAREHGLVVALHAESDAATRELTQAARAAGASGVRAYLRTRPPVTEQEAVALALSLADETGAALHLVHLSTGGAVAQVVEARARGVDVTCETCPHYLYFTEEDVERLGAVLKCAPPLRSQAEQDDLWAHLLAGDIHTIGSDHSPAPPDLKRGDDFFSLWGGISGAQSTFNAVLTAGLPRGLMLEGVARLCAAAPARRLRLHGKGDLRVGADADLTLVDLGSTFTLTELYDRWKHNPYRGESLRGVVRQTFRRGECIYADGVFPTQGGGRWLKPQEHGTQEPL